MKIKTHVNLAELAFNSDLHIVPKGFSHSMFRFGLVMIDLSWHVKTRPHYMQKSFGYIAKKIEKLLSAEKFNAYSSIQLGIIVHYLCDFCCYAHRSGSIGNVGNHIKYELGLQEYLLENYKALKDSHEQFLRNFNPITEDIVSIENSIKDILLNYAKGEKSYLWDITQSLAVISILYAAVFQYRFSEDNEWISEETAGGNWSETYFSDKHAANS